MADAGKITYNLVDLYAVESFDDEKYNVKPNRLDLRKFNGHGREGIGSIDDSLKGASVKQALDFLAEYEGTFRKKHSVVRVLEVIYHLEISDQKVFSHTPFCTKLSFKRYVEFGKPQKFIVNLSVEKIS